MKTNAKQITVEKENGRIYTPLFIVENILDLSGYVGESIIKKHVIDNSCGDGAFLTEIVKRYCEESIKEGLSLEEIREDLKIFIHGIEIEKIERDKCINNLNEVAINYGISDIDWDIVCDNTLNTDKYNNKMDFVLGNPPYVRVHNLGDSFDSIKSFSFAQGGMTDLYIVFYEIGIKMLNNTGVLGYITPSSYFNSLAGEFMRKYFIDRNLISKIVNLKHFQAFTATTYTAITVLKKNNARKSIEYYEYDDNNHKPIYIDSLLQNDYYIGNNFYFSKKNNLDIMKKINNNQGHAQISVKNGYATLCDDVFINVFNFDSPFIIPVIKASKGQKKKIIYPYDTNGKLIGFETIKEDKSVYDYLLSNKEKLMKRSNENNKNDYWYAFGRSQAILDTYHQKLCINSLIRTFDDFKFIDAPPGTGVYSGLYIMSENISTNDIKSVLTSKEFESYVYMLGKYKSGGYYTFSSKDIKLFLDYKFAYDGGISVC